MYEFHRVRNNITSTPSGFTQIGFKPQKKKKRLPSPSGSSFAFIEIQISEQVCLDTSQTPENIICSNNHCRK